jgi:hypothetical protein
MISLAQLRTIPKILPNTEEQEKLNRYLFTLEHAVIDAWRDHKASVTVDRQDDVMDSNELKEYLTSKGYKVTLTRKPPFQIKIFFTEAKF